MPDDVRRYKLETWGGTQAKSRSLKQMHKAMVAQQHPYLTLPRISVRPRRKLCDLTGLPAPYTCPRTLLRFFNLSVFKYLRSLSSEHSEKYYAIKTYGKTMLNGRR